MLKQIGTHFVRAMAAIGCMLILQACNEGPKTQTAEDRKAQEGLIRPMGFNRECPQPAEMKHCVPPVTPPAPAASKSCVAGGCGILKVNVSPETRDSKCTVDFEYGELKISRAARETKVEWELVGGGGAYEFDQAGAAGVGMFQPTTVPGTVKPSDFWEAQPKESDEKKHVVKLLNSAGAKFCHYPRVRPKGTSGNESLCCPIDPLIINEPG